MPDSLVGTDSHTTMINGLGVLGWGVGGSWLQLDRVRSEAGEMQRYLVIWPAPLVFNQWISLSNEIMKIMTWAAMVCLG